MRENADFFLIERVEQILEILRFPLFTFGQYFLTTFGDLQLYDPAIFIGSLSRDM